MSGAVKDKSIINLNQENTYDSTYVKYICTLFATLILGRVYNDVFFYAFAGISLLIFIMSSMEHSIIFLFFLLPFSSILKTGVDAISFFTILVFVTIAKMVLVTKRIESKVVLFLFLFIVFNVTSTGRDSINTLISMIAGMLMLYYIRNTNVNADATVISFSIGICLSSILALFRTSFPIINKFISNATLKLGEDSYAERFVGLEGNPNYYTINIIIALAAIIVIMYNSKPKTIYTTCFVALSAFGLMAISKSFIFAFATLIVFYLFISIRSGAEGTARFLFLVGIASVIAYCFEYEYINASFIRLFGGGKQTLGEFTTGRTDIWSIYIEEIFGSAGTLYKGNGLLAMSKGIGAHNTYIECFYRLGIIGTTLLLASIMICMGKFSLRQTVWLPAVMLTIRMFAVSMLTYDNLWFYFAIILILSKNYQNKQVE